MIIVASRQALARGDDGRPLAIIELNSDITERRRAEAELAHVKRLLERTEEISKIGGWEYDLATGKNTWTEEVCRIFGLDPTSGAPDARGGDRGLRRQQRAGDRRGVSARLLADGEPYDLELGLVRADGQRIAGSRDRPRGDRRRPRRARIRQYRRRHGAQPVRARAAPRPRGTRARAADRRARLVLDRTWGGGDGVVGELFRIFGRDPAAGPPGAAELLTYVHPDDVAAVQPRSRACSATTPGPRWTFGSTPVTAPSGSCT